MLARGQLWGLAEKGGWITLGNFSLILIPRVSTLRGPTQCKSLWGGLD